MNNKYVNVKLVEDGAKLPQRGSNGAVGYDIFSSESVDIRANGKCTVSTGIAIDFDNLYNPQNPHEDVYVRIAPRSGLAAKKHIDIGAGVIDRDYRGVIKVVMFNHANETLHIDAGDKIAQMIFERVFMPDIALISELSETDRGANGFGSTGS